MRKFLPLLILSLQAWSLSVLSLVASSLLAAPALAETLSLPARMDTIDIQGVKRTRREVILRELGVKPGDVVTPEQWQIGVARLWNCNLFSDVHADLEVRDGKNVAIVKLVERWTLNPQIGGAYGGDAFWLQLGAADANFLGRFVALDVVYERFNHYNGFILAFRQPRLFGRRLELSIATERVVRPRPDFVDRRLHARVELNTLQVRDRIRFGGSLDVYQADFVQPTDSSQFILPLSTRGAFADLGLRVGRMDLLRNRQRGFTLELRPGVGVNTRVHPLWGRVTLEGLAFWAPLERWNLAVRVQAGVMTASPDFTRWYLGGLNHIRGYVHNHFRTGDYVLANLEARLVAFDSEWFAVMPAAFMDAVAARDDLLGRTGGLSVGGGVRFLIPAFVRTGLRVDVAVPLIDKPCASTFCPGWSLGVYQLFY